MGKLKEYYHDEIIKLAQNKNSNATIHEQETYKVKKIPAPNVILSKMKNIK